MEIKKGDKVRVSKDAPWLYVGGLDCIFTIYDSVVTAIEDDNAAIKCYHGQAARILIIPTKYLVKVDSEAKVPKFKKGDKVKVNLPRSIRHNTIGTVVFAYASGNAVNVDFGDDEPIYCDCDCLELYTEPTEQTEAEEDARIRQMEAELDRVLHPEKPTYEVTIDNVAMNWQKYEADLAKELAISYAKRGKSPLDAVTAAKEITKRLKQK